MRISESNELLVDILAKGKEKNKIVSNITQSIHFFMLFCILIAAISSTCRKKVTIELWFIIILIGAIAFYAIWETCSRYLLQFYPVILLTTMQGIHTLKIKKRKLLNSLAKTKIMV